MKKYLITLYVIIGLVIIPNAYSQLSDDIGVQLSKTCVVMIKNNMTTNCPTYEEIMFLFPDSSDQRVSGQFVFDGYLKRGEPKIENEFRFYDYDTQRRLFIDPSADVASRLKLIVIEARIDEYKIGTQVINSSSIEVGYDSWVNVGCYNAIITAQNWQLQLGNMIQHLGSDCTINNLDNVKKKTWERVVHDITTSYKYQLEKWIKESIEKCGQRICFYS